MRDAHRVHLHKWAVARRTYMAAHAKTFTNNNIQVAELPAQHLPDGQLGFNGTLKELRTSLISATTKAKSLISSGISKSVGVSADILAVLKEMYSAASVVNKYKRTLIVVCK